MRKCRPRSVGRTRFQSRSIRPRFSAFASFASTVAGGKPVVALVSGANRLDEKRLAAVAGEPVVKADADTARTATGYAIGGVPPFGHTTDVPVFMDRELLEHRVVWAAAGRPDSVFEIEPERLRELSNAVVMDLK